jgi:glycosyltransferase involved in cell wall biosynthesis
VTACFNSTGTIARTIESVNAQDYGGFLEHVFVDGGSRDGTQDLIRSSSRRNTQMVSGPDKGIYDAMNKGIELARGEWLCFLNSDDWLCGPSVISRVAERITSQPDLEFVYGNMVAMRGDEVVGVRGRPIEPRDFWNPIGCMCHQAIFFRKDLFERRGNFSITAKGGISDFVWITRYFNEQPGAYAYIPQDIAHFSEGGYSFTHAWESHLAALDFAREFLPWSKRIRYYLRTPRVFFMIKVLQVHRETAFKRFLRRVRKAILPRRKHA